MPAADAHKAEPTDVAEAADEAIVEAAAEATADGIDEASTRRFRCKRCWHRQAVAAVAAEKDLDRAVKLARCPRCKRRNPGAMLGLYVYVLGALAVVVGIGVIAGELPDWLDLGLDEADERLCRWALPTLAGVIAVVAIPFHVVKRWASVDQRLEWRRRSAAEQARLERFMAVR